MQSERPPVRIEELWFKDCGLVIRAGDCIYRVSDCFERWLGDALTRIPGHARIPYTRERRNARWVTYFLQALFDYSLFEPYPSKVDFDVLTGVLKLSHMYQVGPLRKCALVHLLERIPLSLDVYEDKSLILESPEIIFLLINVAREISADWLLPCALYAACKMLATDDFSLSLRRLDNYAADVVAFLWNPPIIEGCLTQIKCVEEKLYMRRRAEEWRQDGYLPFKIWTVEVWDEDFDVCSHCEDAMRTAQLSAKRKVWDELH
ncbi:hypothetical protein C8J57DRAFT_1718926, partial [Mycena rebaudengoi]